MRICLAYRAHAEGAADPYTSLLPVGLGTINAVLREAGYASHLANFSGMGLEQIIAMFKADPPAILGLSQFTHNRHETLALARLAKEVVPGCFVVFGGPHATHRWQEVLAGSPEVDAVVIGEGEATMLDLARVLSGNGGTLAEIPGVAHRRGAAVIRNERQGSLTALDQLPLSAYYMDDAIGVDPRRQLEFIISSRGCPGNCRFCSSPGFWGRGLRFRSPASIVDEIRYLRDRYGLIYFSIRDDTFTADRQRVSAFCRQLLEERLFILWNCQSRVNAVDVEMLGWMKRAGCECIQLGIESGSPRVLSTLGKQITPEQARKAALAVRQVGMNLSVYLIAGTPGEDEGDVRETCRLIEAIRPHDGQVSPLVYYPGTALFEEDVKAKRVSPDLFEQNKESSCPVRRDRLAMRTMRQMLDSLRKGGEKSAFTPRDIARQKETLGYCHVANLLAGEVYAEQDKTEPAEREYREIVFREPDNPWGWLALGELYGETGRLTSAMHAYEKLGTLVPAHAPAFSVLGELSLVSGDEAEAEGYFRRALELDPFNETARSALGT